MMSRRLTSILVIVAFGGVLVILGMAKEKRVVTPLTHFFEKAVPFQAVPDGLVGIKASDCGVCHTEIYEEWKTSTHARAFTDAQFQSEWAKDGHLWLCINCHTPLENQQEWIVTGYYDGDHHKPVATKNENQDHALEQEGITCAACHVRDGSILGIHENTVAPHPVTVAPEKLSHEACIDCHNVTVEITEKLVCMLKTGEDWSVTEFASGRGTCKDCHMPPVTRINAPGGPPRASRMHTWYGAGITKTFADTSFVPPRSGLTVKIVPGGELRGGESGRLSVNVSNSEAGHTIPTGDVERFVMIVSKLVDETGVVYWEYSEKIGEVWEWSPVPRQLTDNSILYGETRRFDYDVPMPTGKTSLRFDVTIENHRLTPENVTVNKLGDDYPTMRTAFTESLSLDVR